MLAVSISILVVIFETYVSNVINNQPVSITREKAGMIAVLYAGPTFHEEVTSCIACLLHHMGFFVVVYVGNGAHIGDFMIPFSGYRLSNSDRLYGNCVSRWITISGSMPIVHDPRVLIYVTYPIEIIVDSKFRPDRIGYLLLNDIKERKSKTKVMVIVHRSEHVLHHTNIIEKLVPRNQTTYLFLGEHTKNAAKEFISKKKKADWTGLNLDHIYPVMNLRDVLGKEKAEKLTQYKPCANDKSNCPSTFTIQGNFGGKHAHRKDIEGTLNCMRQIESSNQSAIITSVSNIIKTFERNSTNGLYLRGFTNKDSLSIDLVGRVYGTLDPPKLQYGRVRVLNDLNSVDFLKAIASARFLVTALTDTSYHTAKASSSVPAALITEIPIITSKVMLEIYPCLRDAPIHKRFTKDSECESMFAAVDLSEEEYQQAKNEVKMCQVQLIAQSQDTIRALLR